MTENERSLARDARRALLAVRLVDGGRILIPVREQRVVVLEHRLEAQLRELHAVVHRNDDAQRRRHGVRTCVGRLGATDNGRGPSPRGQEIEVEVDDQVASTRRWVHPRWFGAVDVVDRVRWQLQGGPLPGPVGAVRLVAHPSVTRVLEKQNDWLDRLARQVGGAVTLRSDPKLAMSAGHAERT